MEGREGREGGGGGGGGGRVVDLRLVLLKGCQGTRINK